MLCYVFFFFKQKTAYEMRISDWSSDVCSSDLAAGRKEDSRPREAPDGKEPARILSQRAVEGDPARTRQRQWRGRRRSGRAAAQDRQPQNVEGSQGESERRTQETARDGADVGRGDGRAQLSRHADRPAVGQEVEAEKGYREGDRKSTRLNSSH